MKSNDPIVRLIHRRESEVKPGTLEIFDDHTGRIISEFDLRRLQRTLTVCIIDEVTTINKHLFKN